MKVTLTPSFTQATYAGCCEDLRQSFTRCAASIECASLMLSSFSVSAIKQYNTTLKVWWNICSLIHFNFGTNSGTSFSNEDRDIVPWIGILRVKIDTHEIDAATRLILIKKDIAVGIANDIAKINKQTLRTHAKALFYENNLPFQCGITNYILHPEYKNNIILNTLALVNLSCNKSSLNSNPVLWPSDSRIPKKAFIIGLTDSHQRIHQESHEMELLNRSECDDFYTRKELGRTTLHPSHSICYKILNSAKQCVIEPGMALTEKFGNYWKLIGISIHGPGCSLPSRFINFFPYIPWIKSHIIRREKTFRRTNDQYKQGMEEPYDDLDTVMLSKIDDNTIVMRPSLAHIKEHVYGICNPIDGELMYREYGTIKTPGHTTVGVYSVSVHDVLFSPITCVMVTVICTKRSVTNFWLDTGFRQEDIEDIIKIVPTPQRNKTKKAKVLFVKDTHSRFRDKETANLYFKFEFKDVAKLEIEFYGHKGAESESEPESVPTRSLNKSFSEEELTTRLRTTDKEESVAEDPFYSF